MERYQTVFARNRGAVAAPTAGLHFTDEILDTLRERGVTIARLTLHVGLGTFMPMRVDHIEDHKMHSEASRSPTRHAHLASGRPIVRWHNGSGTRKLCASTRRRSHRALYLPGLRIQTRRWPFDELSPASKYAFYDGLGVCRSGSRARGL